MPLDSKPPPQQNPLDRRDLFLYWWPVTARLAGLGIGVYEVLGEQIDRPSVLAFAGALLVAPNIFESQGRRNARRRLRDDD